MAIFSICPFCCQKGATTTTVSEEKLKERELLSRNFSSFLGRYLGAKVTTELVVLGIPGGNDGKALSKVESCQGCLSVIQSICNWYHELKCMELQLEGKIQSLMSILKLANKIKSRKHLLRTAIEGCDDGEENLRITEGAEERKEMYKRVKRFRKELLTKCTNKFSRLYPQVVLTGRLDHVQASRNQSFSSESGDLDTNIKISNENVEALFEAPLKKRIPKYEVDDTDNDGTDDIDDSYYTTDIAYDDNISRTSGDPDTEKTMQQENSEMMIAVVGAHGESVPMEADPLIDENVTKEKKRRMTPRSKKPPSQPRSKIRDSVDSILIDNVKGGHEGESTQRRYNLRETRPSIKLVEDNDCETGNSDAEDEYLNNSDNDDSFSDCSGAGSDLMTPTNQCKLCSRIFKREAYLKMHLRKKSCIYPIKTELTNVNLKEASFSKNSNATRKRKLHSEYTCTENTCNAEFKDKDEYDYHKRLHGNFPCTFCERVETYAPDLCLHEETHAVREEEKLIELIYCPRCPYQVAYKSAYIKHHLSTHLDIVKNQFKKSNCSICNAKVIEKCKDEHFKSHHDTQGIDSHDIIKCDVEPCQAYFLKRNQFFAHRLEVHNRDWAKLPNIDTPNSKTESESEQHEQFQCSYCNRKFKMESWLTKHLKMYHHQQNRGSYRKLPKPFKCPLAECTDKFGSKDGLDIHSKLHGKFKCQFCAVEKDYAPDIALHEAEHAIGNPNETLNKSNATTDEPAEPSTSSGESKRYNCPRCKFFTNLKHSFILHHVQKHLNLSMKTEICEICGVALMKNAEVSHFQSHHNSDNVNDQNDLHKCDKCPAYFLLGIQLITHKNKLHKEGYKCSHCEMTFKTVKSQKNHVRNRHGDIDETNFPEACEVPNCGRKFATKPELEWHTTYGHIYHEKYSGVVKCKICNHPCVGQKGLHVHMKQHTDAQKPKLAHVCDQCGKVFQYKVKLRRHVESVHSDPSTWAYKCSVCSKTCLNQPKLDEHMRTHSKEKPFVCDTCGSAFAHRHNLRHHVKNKHGIELPLLPRFGSEGHWRYRKLPPAENK